MNQIHTQWFLPFLDIFPISQVRDVFLMLAISLPEAINIASGLCTNRPILPYLYTLNYPLE